MCNLYCVLLVYIVFGNKLLITETNGKQCGVNLEVMPSFQKGKVNIIATLSGVRTKTIFRWHCIHKIHDPNDQVKPCCSRTFSSNRFLGVWRSFCTFDSELLSLIYSLNTGRIYFRVEITTGECQNTTAILQNNFRLSEICVRGFSFWMLERSNVFNPLEYTCSTNDKTTRIRWKLLTVSDSKLHTYEHVVHPMACRTDKDAMAYGNVRCVDKGTIWQVTVRVEKRLMYNVKAVYMRCENTFNSFGSNVVNINKIDLNIQGLSDRETVIGRHPLQLTAILSGRSQDPVFQWFLVNEEFHASFKACQNPHTKINIPEWSYLSTCDIQFIDDVIGFKKPLLVKVVVFHNETSVNITTISKNSITFSDNDGIGTFGFRELHIEDLSDKATVLYHHPLKLSAKLRGTSLDGPVFNWTRVEDTSQNVFSQVCTSQHTTTRILGHTYISICNLKPIYAVKLLIEPILIRVTVQDSGIFSNVTKSLKTNTLFSAPWTLHYGYNTLPVITCSFNRSDYDENIVTLKFITPDVNHDVNVNTDVCTFSYNSVIKSAECKSIRGITHIRVFMWKEWNHVNDMFIRCHDINDVTQGSAFINLNDTGITRNESLGIRELHIEDLSEKAEILYRHPLRLTAIFRGAYMDDPLFQWSNVEGTSHDVFFQACSSKHRTVGKSRWSYISTCNLKSIYAVKLLKDPMLIRVTVQNRGILSTATTILKINTLFSAPWTLRVTYDALTTITCSFTQSGYEEIMVTFKFITTDLEHNVNLNTDLCTFSYNSFIQSAECKTARGITHIRVFMWKKWSHVDGMYIRCHDVNDVTRGSAFKHLNNTDVGRNGSLGFRELYIEDLSSRPSVLFRNPLRISAVFNSTSLEKPIFHWSNVVGKSHDVFLQICSSQQTRTYISTCNLKPIYAVKLLTEPMLIRVTVQDSGIFINVTTILKANSLFSAPWTIQAVFKPYTTITCIFSKSSYEHGLIKFNFITSNFNYDVVINIDACALSQNPIVQNVECTTVGGIKIIQVYLREDRSYLREMYSRCHGVTNVTLGSIYIPIYHKVRNLNGYSGVIIFALCVILTMVNIVILIKYGTLLITKYKGRLSRPDNDNQAYATIIALCQSSAGLEADETTFSVESSKYQNIETD